MPTDRELLSSSELFDATWYLNRYRDVGAMGMTALDHYLWLGRRLNRNPGPQFDVEAYLAQNPDVAEAGIDPVLHWLRWGRAEGRAAFPVESEAFVRPQRASPKKRVLYYSHNLRWQGAPNSLFEIASGVHAKTDFSCSVASSDENGQLDHEYEARLIPVNIVRFPSRGVADLRAMYQWIDRLSDFFKTQSFDVVHANTLQSFFAVLAAKRVGIPAILNVRESEDPAEYFQYLPSQIRHMGMEAVKLADKVVFVSEKTRDLWREHISQSRVITINNGVEVNRMRFRCLTAPREEIRATLGVQPEEVVFLSVATIVDRKNQFELLRAIKRLPLSLSKSKLRFVFVGKNDSIYSQDFCIYASKLREAGWKIDIIGETTSSEGQLSLSRYFKMADVFVLPSKVESYPRVVMEAFSFGLPVIATKCFGTLEQIVHGESGLLYDLGDDRALAKCIQYYKEKNVLRGATLKAINRPNKLNSYDAMVTQYSKIYDEILGGDK